jgi:glycosyltransferase involved in cell wall biosynthesis
MLKFSCNETEAVSEATFRQLITQIQQRAADAADGPRGGWRLTTNLVGRSGRRDDPQIATILRCGLFDANYYTSKYRDVSAIGADPLQHYIESGDAEGRWPNAFFDPTFYRKQFERQGLWPFTTLYHYAVTGEAAGIKPSAGFDPDLYLARNAELRPWLRQPLAHFLWIGRFHGLSASRGIRRPADQNVTIKKQSLPLKIAPAGLRRAVNLFGPLDRVGGLGVSARGYLQAVRETCFGPVGTRLQRREYAAQTPIDARHDYPNFIEGAAINLVHMNADTVQAMVEKGGGGELSDRFNIAIWYWELPTMRPEWWAAMDYFHAFWAPTPFVARGLEQLTAKPVLLVPPYLPYLKTARPKRLSKKQEAHFIYCFDANSVVERKNPELLLDGFLKAFPSGADVRLTFKVTNSGRNRSELGFLYAAASQNPAIDIIDRVLSDSDLHRLIASATAYVSPHRSEGLGLTIVEAMAFGTPVIATPFGGPEPFIKADAAWPLRYRLTELAEDHAPYPKGFVWADPELDSVVAALRTVAADPRAARARAVVARDRVLTHFASPALIQTYRDALEHAATMIGL